MSRTLDILGQDIGAALRRLRRRPISAIAPISITAAGIAAAVAIVCVLDNVLFRPLPFPEADRLVAVYAVDRTQEANQSAEGRWDRRPMPWSAWQALSTSPVFDTVGAWANSRPVLGQPAEDVVETWHVSSSLLRVLGVDPSMGRSFTPDEDQSSTSGVVLLSWEAWRRRYGGRQDILGHTVVLSFFAGQPEAKTVVGVLPPGVSLNGPAPEFFLPLGERAAWATWKQGTVYILARLSAESSQSAAASAVAAVTSASVADPHVLEARVVSLRTDIVGNLAPPVWLLVLTAVTVLLVACTSTAGLSLTEAHDRSREMMVRVALGGTRRAITKQLFVEHALKATVAAAIGAIIAAWLVRIVGANSAVGPGAGSLQGSTLLLASLVGAIVILTFGIGPSLLTADRSLANTLRGHRTRQATAGQRMVTACQLAISLVLLVCAVLLGQTLTRLTSQPLGFEPANLAVLAIKSGGSPRVTHVPAGQVRGFATWTHTEGLLNAIRGVPGVLNAAGISAVPFGGDWKTVRMRPADDAQAPHSDVQLLLVTSNYFNTLGMRLLSGRDLLPEDRLRGPQQTQLSVVASEEVTLRLGGGAIGRRLVETRSGLSFEIVGVVKDTKQRRFTDSGVASLYALSPTDDGVSNIVVRTATEPTTLLPILKRTVEGYDPSMLLTSVQTMEHMLGQAVSSERFRARFAAVFGGAALFLAVCGMYAVSVRVVANRSHELGVRLALGATRASMMGFVLKDGIKTLSLGTAIGLPLAFIAAHSLRGLVYGVSPASPELFLVSAAVLSMATLIALVLPARQATKVDPMTSLRVGSER